MHEAKAEVIDRLLAEEMSLVEAAAWFRYLNENPPERAGLPPPWPRRQRRRKVVPPGHHPREEPTAPGGATTGSTAFDGHEHPAVGRLERELDCLLSRGSQVELPW